MGDFEEKLEGILNNPQAMQQIMSLAQSLGSRSSSPEAQQQPSPNPPPAAGESAAGTGDILGQLDPRLLSMAAKLMGEYNSGNDDRTALLQALRPFVKESRYAKLDKAIQIARLSRVIRMGLEVFRSREDGNV